METEETPAPRQRADRYINFTRGSEFKRRQKPKQTTTSEKNIENIFTQQQSSVIKRIPRVNMMELRDGKRLDTTPNKSPKTKKLPSPFYQTSPFNQPEETPFFLERQQKLNTPYLPEYLDYQKPLTRSKSKELLQQQEEQRSPTYQGPLTRRMSRENLDQQPLMEELSPTPKFRKRTTVPQPVASPPRRVSWVDNVVKKADKWGFESDRLLMLFIATGKVLLIPFYLLKSLFRLFLFFFEENFFGFKTISSILFCFFIFTFFIHKEPSVAQKTVKLNSEIPFENLFGQMELKIKNLSAKIEDLTSENYKQQKLIYNLEESQKQVKKQKADLEKKLPDLVKKYLDSQEIETKSYLKTIKDENGNQKLSIEPLFESLLNEKLQKIGNVPASDSEGVQKMIHDALNHYMADRNGKPDYALRTNGGRIIRYRGLTSKVFVDSYGQYQQSPLSTFSEMKPPSVGFQSASSDGKTPSVSFQPSASHSGFLGWIQSMVWPHYQQPQPPPMAQPPEVILEQMHQPGQCWSFSGQQGQATILLAKPIYPTEVSIEHLRRELWPEWRFAPKRIQVWGLSLPLSLRQMMEASYKRFMKDGSFLKFVYEGFQSTKDKQSILLKEIEYNAESGSDLQTFSLNNQSLGEMPKVDLIQLRFLTNWGFDAYTCVYRVRIHGNE